MTRLGMTLRGCRARSCQIEKIRHTESCTSTWYESQACTFRSFPTVPPKAGRLPAFQANSTKCDNPLAKSVGAPIGSTFSNM